MTCAFTPEPGLDVTEAVLRHLRRRGGSLTPDVVAKACRARPYNVRRVFANLVQSGTVIEADGAIQLPPVPAVQRPGFQWPPAGSVQA